MNTPKQLLQGYKRFQEYYFVKNPSLFCNLKQNQSPETLIIGCSDSRIDPVMLTNAQPGDIFVVRNVANIIPRFRMKNNSFQYEDSVGAALEFAVCMLNIKHIVVLGHSQCGGISTLIEDKSQRFTCINNWISNAIPALDEGRSRLRNGQSNNLQQATEQANIILSLTNLHTYPFIIDNLSQQTLTLHGWYFNISDGELLIYNQDTSYDFCSYN